MKKLLALILLVCAVYGALFAQTLPPLYKQVYTFQNRVQVVDPAYTFGATSPTLTGFPLEFFWSDYFINQNPPGNGGPVAQQGSLKVDLVANGSRTVTSGGKTLTYLEVAALIQQIGTDNYAAPPTGSGVMSLSRATAAKPAKP